jgi:hypothetical protein
LIQKNSKVGGQENNKAGNEFFFQVLPLRLNPKTYGFFWPEKKTGFTPKAKSRKNPKKLSKKVVCRDFVLMF